MWARIHKVRSRDSTVCTDQISAMADKQASEEPLLSPSSCVHRISLYHPPNGTVAASESAASEPSSSRLPSFPSELAGPATSTDADDGACRPSAGLSEEDASSSQDQSPGEWDSNRMDCTNEGIAYSETTDSSEVNLETLAKGISSVMGPVMKSFDAGVEGALKSQSILASSIDRLTRELDKLLEDVPLPLAMRHAAKLANVRSRVASLNASLRIVQKRMENIERLIAGYAAKSKHRKDIVERTQPTSQSLISSRTHISSDSYDNEDILRRLFSEDETDKNVMGNSESSESQEFHESHFPAFDDSSSETIYQDDFVAGTGINETEITQESEHVNSTCVIKDVRTDDMISTEQNEH